MRKAILLIVVVGAALATWRFAAESRGQPKGQPVEKQPLPGVSFYESNSCHGCHSKPQPFVDPVIMPIICRCNEFDIWETTDKHRLAYVALKGERARTMGKNLNIDVLTDKSCVSCHGVYIADKKLRQENHALVEEGVSCFVCHGPDKGWLDVHGSNNKNRRRDWRDKSRAEKHETFGMADLWDPVKRTKLCVSCHIGNAQEGKVITHEMYAAGHPPLPSFDMSNFSDAMRHWQTLGEKKPEVLKEFRYNAADVDLEQANLVYLGNLVSFEQTIRLLENQAKDKAAWPELAQFDCYACHHDLKSKSWRQKRGYDGGKPGRPQMQAWAVALVEVALHHTAGGDAEKAEVSIKTFNAKLKKLRAIYDDKPFGDPDQIAEAARDLADWVGQQAKDAKLTGKIDSSSYQRMLAGLVDKQKGKLHDYDSARQVAGAFRAIYLEGWKKQGLDKEVLSQFKALDDDLHITLDSEARSKFRQVRIGLTKDLMLVRKDRPQEVGRFLDKNVGALQDNYAAELADYLDAINRYDAEAFQERLRNLATAVLAKPAKTSR